VTDGPPVPGRLLAVDWGEKRFGIARSDEGRVIAQPLTTLTRRAGKRFPMQELIALVHEHHATGVLVSLPLAEDGSEGDPARAARELAQEIASRTNLPVDLWDERFTTARALRAVREMGGRTRGRKEDVDALAATLLLQHYLDAKRARTDAG